MYEVSLLGCGKLGFPLAIKLINLGFKVKGSTTTQNKINIFKKSGIVPYLINVDKYESSDFLNSDILVITLPYKKSFLHPEYYKNQIDIICNKLKKSSVKHILFTSSSSIYPKDKKNYLPCDHFIPPSNRSKILLECEQTITKVSNKSSIIIRLGGIIRKNKKIIPNSKSRRLIFQNDAIELIINHISRIGHNEIINGFQNLII